jgi:hypothetical protein
VKEGGALYSETPYIRAHAVIIFARRSNLLWMEGRVIDLQHKVLSTLNMPHAVTTWGHAVAQLVEALRCKPECRGFDSQ